MCRILRILYYYQVRAITGNGLKKLPNAFKNIKCVSFFKTFIYKLYIETISRTRRVDPATHKYSMTNCCNVVIFSTSGLMLHTCLYQRIYQTTISFKDFWRLFWWYVGYVEYHSGRPGIKVGRRTSTFATLYSTEDTQRNF